MFTYTRKLLGLAIIILFVSNNAYAISHAVRSQMDYGYILDKIRRTTIMVENFAADDLKKEFSDIRTLFTEASEQHFGRNYVDSATKFVAIKYKLIDFLEKLSKIYLQRTKNIMDSTSKQSMDILVEYSKNSGMAAYFRKPYDPNDHPTFDKKNYDITKYHYFHHRTTIQNYLKSGYEKYHEANQMLSDKNIVYIKQRKAKTRKGLNYIIDQYTNIIYLCRTAKQYGLEIHKILNNHLMGQILRKYNLKDKSITPIFDDRIPDEYKVDANDNISYIHKKELDSYKDNYGKEHPSKNKKIDDTKKDDKSK